MTALEDILRVTEARVRALVGRRDDLERAAAAAPAAPDWVVAFAGRAVSVIGEIKRRSPSAGVIAAALNPVSHARAYEAGGASAISVLTEGAHFGGALEDLQDVRAAVGIPVLRKDFVVDPLQLYETRAAGASAVLLIVRILGAGQLRELSAVAADLGLARLVEVHTPRELDRALSLTPEAVGVNSRDLATFQVSVEGIASLLGEVPPGTIAVAESGIAGRTDVERVAAWGADAILVGTSVAGDPDPRTALQRLTGVARRERGGGMSSRKGNA
jgi:indole-3-glycerol phosphate synthase